MAVYGYLENKKGTRYSIEALGIVMPAGWTEQFDDEDIRSQIGQIYWNRAVSELEALVAAGDLEIRDADNTTVINVGEVQGWVDKEILTESSLPQINITKIETNVPGKAMITKVVAGVGITLDSTGADEGTGEVTINANLSATLPDFVIARSCAAIVHSRDGGFILARP